MEDYTNGQLGQMMVDGFKGIHARQDITNGNVKENTAYRLKATGGFNVLKFILGFVGIGNIIILFKLFI